MQDADLVTLEFASGDPVNLEGPLSTDHPKVFERLLRRALTLRSRPALALLSHFNWHASLVQSVADKDKKVPAWYNT